MPKALAKALEVLRAPSAGIPLDIMTPLQDKRVSGRLKVIVEGMPLGSTLSAGTNNWDNTWSLALDALSGLQFFPAQGDDRASRARAPRAGQQTCATNDGSLSSHQPVS